MIKAWQFCVILLVCQTLWGNDFQDGEHDFTASGILYNRDAVRAIHNLEELEFPEHIRIFYEFKDLGIMSLVKTTYLPIQERMSQFSAHAPTITWKGDHPGIDCDVVINAKRAAQDFFDRFKFLRTRALDLLDKMATSRGRQLEQLDHEYDAVLAEIVDVARRVEREFPPSFYTHDRIGTYLLTRNQSSHELMNSDYLVAFGEVRVSKIKIGSNDWMPISSGLLGFADIKNEPRINEYGTILLRRELTPEEACLSDLNLALVGHVMYGEREDSVTFIDGDPIMRDENFREDWPPRIDDPLIGGSEPGICPEYPRRPRTRERHP